MSKEIPVDNIERYVQNPYMFHDKTLEKALIKVDNDKTFFTFEENCALFGILRNFYIYATGHDLPEVKDDRPSEERFLDYWKKFNDRENGIVADETAGMLNAVGDVVGKYGYVVAGYDFSNKDSGLAEILLDRENS